jgi:hypothetical protein
MNREQYRASILADQAKRNYSKTYICNQDPGDVVPKIVHLPSNIRADLSWIKQGCAVGLAVGLSLTVVHYWPQIVATVLAVVS